MVSTPLSNPNNIYTFFENWETYGTSFPTNAYPTVSTAGAAYSIRGITEPSGFNIGQEKVPSGSRSLQITAPTNRRPGFHTTFPSTADWEFGARSGNQVHAKRWTGNEYQFGNNTTMERQNYR